MAGSASAYATSVLSDSPWGFWKCDETSGTTLADSSGNSRSMTVTGGAPTYAQTGPDGTAADAITWGDSSGATEHYAGTSATVGTSFGTLEGWIYLTSLPTANTVVIALSQGYGSATYDKELYVDSTGHPAFYCYTGATTTITGSSTLSLNTWHHMVGSVGAAGMKLRVDGVTVATNAATSSYSGTQNVFIHGGGGSGGFLDLTNSAAVKLGPCAFWASQLTDAKTDAHYGAMLFNTQLQVSRVHAEELGIQQPSIRTSRIHADILERQSPTALVSRIHADILEIQSPTAQISQVFTEILTSAAGRVKDSTISETWNVAAPGARVNGTLSETWNVAGRVTGTGYSETWNVASRVSGTLSETWNVIARVQGTLSETWNVSAALTRVNGTGYTENWNVLKRIFKGTAETWTVNSRVTGTTYSETWNVATRLQKTTAESWTVYQRVPTTLSERWNVSARVLATLDEQWNVNGRGGFKTFDVIWDVNCFQAWDGAHMRELEWLGLWDGEALQAADIALWDGSDLVPFN